MSGTATAFMTRMRASNAVIGVMNAAAVPLPIAPLSSEGMERLAAALSRWMPWRSTFAYLVVMFAGPERSIEEVADVVIRLARCPHYARSIGVIFRLLVSAARYFPHLP